MASSPLRAPGGQYDIHWTPDGKLTGGGRIYDFTNGTAHLYDADLLSPILSKDLAFFRMLQDSPSAKQPNHDDVTAAYQRAKLINTEFMFSAIDYEGIEDRVIVELGVGGADLIKKWTALTPHAYAVDFFTWEMEDGLAEHVAAGGRPFIPVSAVMASLPFADASVDLLYMHAAIHHALPLHHSEFRWSDPRNMTDCLREVRRVLKPDGLFFLMGEGVYPEGVKPEERVHEVRCQSDNGWPYEAHYTLSEYEAAYREAGMFPHVFSNQDDFRLEMDFYVDGVAHRAITAHDNIGRDNYGDIGSVLSRAGAFINRTLPEWARWK